MGGAEIAKDAIRIATTAGLSKDVIDLLKEKIALLTEQIATLEQEKSALQAENSHLKQKIENLEREIERTRPKQGDIDESAKKFIKVLFECDSSMDFDYVAAMLGVSKGKATYYIDVLIKNGMITGTGMVLDDALGAYGLTAKGREFAVTSGLA
jgi:regulator of replication initiation timing